MQLIYLLLLLSLPGCYSHNEYVEYIKDLESKPVPSRHTINQQKFHVDMNKVQKSGQSVINQNIRTKRSVVIPPNNINQ